MPSKVYCNVEKYKLLDNNREIEGVTKIGLPTIKHPTTEIKDAGMSVTVDMPDTTHLESMDFTVYHNNGVNCNYLMQPGKHTIEARIARQRYDVAKGEIMHESVKYRVTGVYVSTENGDVETGSPLGSTVKYSVLRFEEEVDGKVITTVDATAGLLKFNGVNITSNVDNLLK